MPMTSHAPSNRPDDPAAPTTLETSTSAGQLFRQLVGEVEARNPPSQASADPITEAIILDRTVDGVRYLLLRMPSIPLCQVPLSPRESEIARMVADGHQTKVIAGVLNISCWTVTAHLRRIFVKLGVTSRAGMTGKLLEQQRQRDPSVCPDSQCGV
jgi:DNA-binding CsgD family transcriptional regulator